MTRFPWSVYRGSQCVGVGTVEAPDERSALNEVLGGRVDGFKPKPDDWYKVKVAGQVASAQGAEMTRVAESSSLPDDGSAGRLADADVRKAAKAQLDEFVRARERKAASDYQFQFVPKDIYDGTPRQSVMCGCTGERSIHSTDGITWICDLCSKQVIGGDARVGKLGQKSGWGCGHGNRFRNQTTGVERCADCGAQLTGPQPSRCSQGIHDNLKQLPDGRGECRECGWRTSGKLAASGGGTPYGIPGDGAAFIGTLRSRTSDPRLARRIIEAAIQMVWVGLRIRVGWPYRIDRTVGQTGCAFHFDLPNQGKRVSVPMSDRQMEAM